MEEIINLSELFERKRVTDNLCKVKHKTSKGEWNLKSQKKIIKYLKDVENPYILSFEGMIVEFEYVNEKRTFNQCMVNILKKRV